MKKLTFTLFIALAVACLFSVPCNAKGKAKHVVFIGLDGWGSYSVPKADIPHIKQLMADGSYTLEKRTVLPSSSAVNWASMFMGAGPELHGYTQWGSKTPELPSRVLNQHGIFPTIFQLLRDARPEARRQTKLYFLRVDYLLKNSLDYFPLFLYNLFESLRKGRYKKNL